ncbi:Oxysterol-binding protein-related protein 1 [Mactra antiquata]
MSEPESPEEEISLEESLLQCARRGQASIIDDILKSRKDGKIEVDINCKGSQKANRGWTPLHLSAYFGHVDVVKILIQNGASVNEVNNLGDTPLHKAAHTGRLDVVTLLLQHEADVSVINAEGHTAKTVAKTDEITKLIEAAELHDASRQEEEFMTSVRLGHVDEIDQLVTKGTLSMTNCKDSFGNTPLHIAAQAGQKEAVVYLLQKGLNSSIKNNQGLLPCDVAKTEQMKQLLNVKPKTEAIRLPSRFEGLLIKKKFVGSTPVWVVLERGVLSYFRNRGDAATGTKRRGMKYLDNAQLSVSEQNVYDFLVTYSDGTCHRLGLDPGASEVRLGRDPATGEVVSRQMWLNSLKEHIQYNTHYIKQGDLKQNESKEEIHQIDTLQTALKVAQAHQSVLKNHIKSLDDTLKSPTNKNKAGNSSMSQRSVIEKIITYSNDMCTSLDKCLDMFIQEEEDRDKVLHEEQEKNRVLQEALHALAIEHHELERTYSHNVRTRHFSVDGDDEFFDCDDLEDIDIHLPLGSPDVKSIYSDAMSYKSCFNDGHEDKSVTGVICALPNFQLSLGGRYV